MELHEVLTLSISILAYIIAGVVAYMKLGGRLDTWVATIIGKPDMKVNIQDCERLTKEKIKDIDKKADFTALQQISSDVASIKTSILNTENNIRGFIERFDERLSELENKFFEHINNHS
jgi:hypothetical protein